MNEDVIKRFNPDVVYVKATYIYHKSCLLKKSNVSYSTMLTILPYENRHSIMIIIKRDYDFFMWYNRSLFFRVY